MDRRNFLGASIAAAFSTACAPFSRRERCPVPSRLSEFKYEIFNIVSPVGLTGLDIRAGYRLPKVLYVVDSLCEDPMSICQPVSPSDDILVNSTSRTRELRLVRSSSDYGAIGGLIARMRREDETSAVIVSGSDLSAQIDTWNGAYPSQRCRYMIQDLRADQGPWHISI